MSTISLIAQKTITNGIILSKSDSTKIAHAHIINTTSKTGVTSNDNGGFVIQTNATDTLIISFIGYQSLTIKASELTNNIYLERAVYSIDPYTVLPYKNFQEFKIAFLNLKLEDTLKHKMNPSIIELIDPFNPINLNGGIIFSGPISAIAAKFNKRIKDRKNYERLLRRDQYETFLATKFNTQIVTQATSLKKDYQIESFMEYCDFTNQFIEYSSLYNIIDQIINCYEEYRDLPMTTN